MVFLIDEGSVFDAPVDKIWKYLSSDQHQHKISNVISREVNGNSVVITAERNIMGKMVRTRIRNTLYPPLGMIQEHLEGPTAGSRALLYYTPRGDKTAVTVVGDFTISGIDEKQTKEAVLTQSQAIFEEDNSNLKRAK